MIMNSVVAFEYKKEFGFGYVKVQQLVDEGRENHYQRVEVTLEYGKENPVEQVFKSWDDDDLLAYPSLVEELVHGLDKVEDDSSVIARIMNMVMHKGFAVNEERRRMVENKTIEGIKNLSKNLIMSDALKELTELAENVYDGWDETLGMQMYEIIMGLTKGKNLTQIIQGYVLEQAEKYNVKLNQDQLQNIINPIETWVDEGLQESVEMAFKETMKELEPVSENHEPATNS